jgi:hypothetical protein
MPIQDYGRAMGNAAEFAQMPVNALIQGRQRQAQDARIAQADQQRNVLFQQGQQDRVAAQTQDDEEDAAWDAAYAQKDWATLARIDPQTTKILYELENKQAEPPLTLRTQPGPFGSQIVTDGRSRFQVVEPPRPTGGADREPPKPQLVDVAQEDGTTQKQWLRPGETQGPSVGVPSTGQQLSPKDTNTARVKLNQVKIARQALQRVKDRWQTIQGGATAGPLQGYIPSEGGKAFDAATNAMRGSITALTRVPGVGAMSDYETRLDQSKFPERTSYESVTADQIQGLEDLLNNVESGYQEMLGTKPAAPKGAPKPGDNVKGYIFIGGNPADKSRWVKAK